MALLAVGKLCDQGRHGRRSELFLNSPVWGNPTNETVRFKFLNRLITVFPAAICATPKTQREKASSSPRTSWPVSKDEADP
jgi:hypothetical protein